MTSDQALQRAVAIAKWSRDVNPGIFMPMSLEQAKFKENLFKKLVEQGGQSEEEAREEIDNILEELESFML